MSKQSSKFWLRIIGWLISIACLAAVVIQLRRFENWQLLQSSQLLLPMIAAAGIYLLGLISTASAWHAALPAYRGERQSYLAAVGTYSFTQLAKYLPGNIMHLVFRYAYTRRDGLSRGSVLYAALLEPISLLLAAAVVVLIAAFDWLQNLDSRLLWLLLPALLAVLAAPFLLRHGFAYIARRQPRFQGDTPAETMPLRALILITLWQLGFFLLFGLSAQIIAVAAALPAAPLHIMMAATAAGWAAGFVTPGAPAGLGVREVVMSSVLAPYMDAPSAVLLAALLRLISTAADCLLFVAGAVWRWRIGGVKAEALARYQSELEESPD